jgi:hypothetical protein
MMTLCTVVLEHTLWEQINVINVIFSSYSNLYHLVDEEFLEKQTEWDLKEDGNAVEIDTNFDMDK